MTAESVEYVSLRHGDAFLRASNGHPIAAIVSRFESRAVVTAVRCP